MSGGARPVVRAPNSTPQKKSANQHKENAMTQALRSATTATGNATAPRPITQLTIFSPARSIEHVELSAFLQSGLGISCRLCVDLEALDCSELLLFDCHEVSAQRIHYWLRQQRERQREPRCALFNLNEGSVYERLMDWPQILGIFYSNYSHPVLQERLQRILAGELSLPERLCQEFVNRLRRAPTSRQLEAEAVPLTSRELQILEGVYSGFSNARIARQLNLSEHTIKSHLYNAYRKLGISSRLEACAWMRDNYPFNRH